MDETNIFIIGVLVTILSAIGVIYTIMEFREMSKKGPKNTGGNEETEI